MKHVYKEINSPVGKLKLIANDRALIAVLWESDNIAKLVTGEIIRGPSHPILVQTEQELKEYFAEKRTKFTVPLEPVGTPFQRKVWQALTTIPFGETRSYGELARQIGKPAASRAVGAANGKNPISIIIPCHRVIGSTGTLTGFGGGLKRKAQLLTLEGSKFKP